MLRFINSANVTLTPGGLDNGHQSGVVGITDQRILQNGKRLRGVQEEQERAQNTALQHA